MPVDKKNFADSMPEFEKACGKSAGLRRGRRSRSHLRMFPQCNRWQISRGWCWPDRGRRRRFATGVALLDPGPERRNQSQNRDRADPRIRKEHADNGQRQRAKQIFSFASLPIGFKRAGLGRLVVNSSRAALRSWSSSFASQGLPSRDPYPLELYEGSSNVAPASFGLLQFPN